MDALFTSTTTSGGTFSGTGVVGNTLQYSAPGCYTITYTVSSFTGATGLCTATDMAMIYIPETPVPIFDIQNEVCISAGDATQTFTPNVGSGTYTTAAVGSWAITDNVTGATAAISSTTGVVTLTPTGGAVSGSYLVTYTETITNPACIGTPIICTASTDLSLIHI